MKRMVHRRRGASALLREFFCQHDLLLNVVGFLRVVVFFLFLSNFVIGPKSYSIYDLVITIPHQGLKGQKEESYSMKV